MSSFVLHFSPKFRHNVQMIGGTQRCSLPTKSESNNFIQIGFKIHDYFKSWCNEAYLLKRRKFVLGYFLVNYIKIIQIKYDVIVSGTLNMVA